MARGESSSNMEHSPPSHLRQGHRKKKNKFGPKEVVVEEPHPPSLSLHLPRVNHQDNEANIGGGIEHITHYYLDNVPEKFKTKLLWVQGLPLSESTCLNWILFTQLRIEDAI
ncbi:unnamed protein product [Linum trigynum]|uniref:Uncharacterized protein n=1 Tax=Linum trigynum TaxID=586398 RepID=A0AAV2CY25_9ROSI